MKTSKLSGSHQIPQLLTLRSSKQMEDKISELIFLWHSSERREDSDSMVPQPNVKNMTRLVQKHALSLNEVEWE